MTVARLSGKINHCGKLTFVVFPALSDKYEREIRRNVLVRISFGRILYLMTLLCIFLGLLNLSGMEVSGREFYYFFIPFRLLFYKLGVGTRVNFLNPTDFNTWSEGIAFLLGGISLVAVGVFTWVGILLIHSKIWNYTKVKAGKKEKD